MKYNSQIPSKNKLKQLFLFYIKINVWIDIGKADSSHFIYHEMLPFFNLNTLLNLGMAAWDTVLIFPTSFSRSTTKKWKQ